MIAVMKRNTKIGIGIGAVLLTVVLILGYYGFVPFLSDLMGANKNRDLGVKFTNSDYDSSIKKLGLVINTNLTDTTPLNSYDVNKKTVAKTTTLNSAELTALANKLADSWIYFPLDNIQIRINSDGSVEILSTLILNRFEGFASAMKMPDSTLNIIRPIIAMIQTNPSFYIKGSIAINNGVAQSTLSQVQIGNINVSSSDLKTVQTYLDLFLEKQHLTNVTFGNEVVNIEGNIPTALSFTPP
jgi:hypothetical protein